MKQKEGYLFVDHSASPGLPEDVARASGYDPLMCKEGKRYEAATLTCAHCKAAVVKNPFRSRARELCMKCGGKYICDVCAFRASLSGYNHAPFEKYVDVTADLWSVNRMMRNYNELLFGDPVRTAKPLVAPSAPIATAEPPPMQKEQTHG